MLQSIVNNELGFNVFVKEKKEGSLREEQV